MEVNTACEKCDWDVSFDPEQEVPEECPGCGETFRFQTDGVEGDHLEYCVECGGEHFYQHTQINQLFGLALLFVACLVFGYFVWQVGGMIGFLWGIAALFLAVGVDRLLYWILPEVVLCYRCKTIYQDVDPDQHFGEYDHELEVELKHRG